uniref:Uncharacterized protein n=1 Tax=Romanomermis culicivorax TaxID=13658 RepID=A0A915JV61_ROMCU
MLRHQMGRCSGASSVQEHALILHLCLRPGHSDHVRNFNHPDSQKTRQSICFTDCLYVDR